MRKKSKKRTSPKLTGTKEEEQRDQFNIQPENITPHEEGREVAPKGVRNRFRELKESETPWRKGRA